MVFTRFYKYSPSSWQLLLDLPFNKPSFSQAPLALQTSDHVGGSTECCISGFKSHLEGRWAKTGAMQGNQEEPSLAGVLAQLQGLVEFAHLWKDAGKCKSGFTGSAGKIHHLFPLSAAPSITHTTRWGARLLPFFILQLPVALEHWSPDLEVSQFVPWQWSIIHSVSFVLPFHYKPLLSRMWLCHTSAIQLDISYASGWFLGAKLSQILSLSLWTLSGFANIFFFFFYHFKFTGSNSWLVSLVHNCCVRSQLRLLSRQIANCIKHYVFLVLLILIWAWNLFFFCKSSLSWTMVAETSGACFVIQSWELGCITCQCPTQFWHK